MRTTLFLFAFFAGTIFCFSQTKIEWVRFIRSTGEDMVNFVKPDNKGHIYITGSFSDTADLGNNQYLISEAEKDIFFAKYSSDGNIIWAVSAKGESGGVYGDMGWAIDFDMYGNLLLCGKFFDDTWFENIRMTSKGDADIFLAKYDSSGTLLNVISLGGPGDDSPRKILYNNSFDFYLAGFFHNTIDLRSGKIKTSVGKGDAFLAKYDSSFNCLWAVRSGSSYGEGFWDYVIDRNQNVTVVGRIGDGFDIDGFGNNNTNGDCDIYLIKFTSDGNVDWYHNFGGSLMDVGRANV